MNVVERVAIGEKRYRTLFSMDEANTALEAVLRWRDEGVKMGLADSIKMGNTLGNHMKDAIDRKKGGLLVAMLLTEQQLFVVANAIGDWARYFGGDKGKLLPAYGTVEKLIKKRFKPSVYQHQLVNPVKSWGDV